MARTIPIIITNKNILVKMKDTAEFSTFEMQGIDNVVNVPFYHQFASRIAECQHCFKDFIKKLYGKKFNKNILAIVVPDDTSELEKIFIREFFVNSGACKAVAEITMGQALSKTHSRYISISKSQRNVCLQYINNNEIRSRKFYDIDDYSPKAVYEDAKRLHIDIEYAGVPVFINNFNMNMDDFFELGEVITPKDFMDKIAVIDVEKI